MGSSQMSSLPYKIKPTIRRADLDDVAAISGILRDLDWFAHIRDEAFAETETRIKKHLDLCSADDSHSIMVAENSERKVVAYAAVHWLPYLMLTGPEGFISELFVLEQEQGKGIGQSLLEEVKKMARGRGCSRLHLITGNYRQSYKFYQKLGWTERPKIANFIFPLA